jgi:hypothetical protein
MDKKIDLLLNKIEKLEAQNNELREQMTYVNKNVKKITKKVIKRDPTIEYNPEKLKEIKEIDYDTIIEKITIEKIIETVKKQNYKSDYDLIRKIFVPDSEKYKCPWKWNSESGRIMYYWSDNQWNKSNGQETKKILIKSIFKLYSKALTHAYKNGILTGDDYISCQNYHSKIYSTKYGREFIKCMKKEVITEEELLGDDK